MAVYTSLLFILGLWPFNFTEKNNAIISSASGLEVARHGTAYTVLPAGKLQDLKQFAIHIDLATSSDGLDSLEKIFGHLISQEAENFFLAQWKDGMELRVRHERNAAGMIFGADGVLEKEKRAAYLIIYDGQKMHLYKNGTLVRRDTRGPLSFINWSREYPLVIGMDAGGRSQWKGTIYEVAIYDRPLSAREIAELSVHSSGKSDRSGNNGKSIEPQAASHKTQAKWQENPPVSPFTKGGGKNENAAGEKTPPHLDPLPPGARGIVGKGARRPLAMTEKGAEGILRQAQDDRPLVHYVFRPENTYETEFRGKKALGVRDLGKGEAEDLVIPEQFAPYKRVILGWGPDWMNRSSEWVDLVVNIVGFVPFGLLLTLAFRNGLRSVKCYVLSEENKEGFGIQDSGVGIKEENPPVSSFAKGGKRKGEIAAGQNTRPHPDPLPSGAREILEKGVDRPLAMTSSGTVLVVVLAVAVGFGVSMAIELIQAYLPSRDSSLRDLATNTAGTLFGALAAVWYSRKRIA